MDFKHLYENELYELIYKNKEQITEDDFIYLIKSLFYLEKSDYALSLLKKKEFLSEEEYFYSILFHMLNSDYLNIIKIVEKLKEESIFKNYLEKDETNFLNLLAENIDTQLLVIICLFIKNNLESIYKCLVKSDFTEITYIYFALISNLYEMGYSKDIIDKLSLYGQIIYKI